jgi:hypothetical protein
VSKTPILFASAANFLVCEMLDKSAMRTPSAPGTAAIASFARWVLRACKVTWCPWAIKFRATICPIPSEEPVMNMRAIVGRSLLLVPSGFEVQDVECKFADEIWK